MNNADATVIEDAIAAVEEARARAPRDFLAALAIALVAASIGCLAIALIVGAGVLRDLMLNLGVELVGAVITVVVIDGVWKRREAAATASMSLTLNRLDARRRSTIVPAERAAWQGFVDDYRELTRRQSVVNRIRDLPAYRRRLTYLERRADSILETYEQR